VRVGERDGERLGVRVGVREEVGDATLAGDRTQSNVQPLQLKPQLPDKPAGQLPRCKLTPAVAGLSRKRDSYWLLDIQLAHSLLGMVKQTADGLPAVGTKPVGQDPVPPPPAGDGERDGERLGVRVGVGRGAPEERTQSNVQPLQLMPQLPDKPAGQLPRVTLTPAVAGLSRKRDSYWLLDIQLAHSLLDMVKQTADGLPAVGTKPVGQDIGAGLG